MLLTDLEPQFKKQLNDDLDNFINNNYSNPNKFNFQLLQNNIYIYTSFHPHLSNDPNYDNKIVRLYLNNDPYFSSYLHFKENVILPKSQRFTLTIYKI